MNRCTVLVAAVVLLSACVAEAQQWQIVETFPGKPAGNSFFSPDNVELIIKVRDFNGDSVPDNVLIKPEAGGHVLAVRSGANPAQSWALPCAPFGSSEKFVGFYNFDGMVNSGNPKEVILAQQQGRRYLNAIVLYDIDLDNGTCRVHNIESGTVLLSVIDPDKDGVLELVIADPVKSEIQIWALQ